MYIRLGVCTHFSLKREKWWYHFHACLSSAFLTKVSSIFLFKLWENAPIPVLTDTGKWGGLTIDSLPYIHDRTWRTCTIKLHTAFLHGPWWCERKQKLTSQKMFTQKTTFLCLVTLVLCFTFSFFLRQGDQAPSMQFKGHSPRYICCWTGPRVWPHVWRDQGGAQEEG